jgi:hypothetical protein
VQILPQKRRRANKRYKTSEKNRINLLPITKKITRNAEATVVSTQVNVMRFICPSLKNSLRIGRFANLYYSPYISMVKRKGTTIKIISSLTISSI